MVLFQALRLACNNRHTHVIPPRPNSAPAFPFQTLFSQVVSLLLSAGADAAAVDLARCPDLICQQRQQQQQQQQQQQHPLEPKSGNVSSESQAPMTRASFCCRCPCNLLLRHSKPVTKKCRCCSIQITTLRQRARGRRRLLAPCDDRDEHTSVLALLFVQTRIKRCKLFDPAQRAHQ